MNTYKRLKVRALFSVIASFTVVHYITAKKGVYISSRQHSAISGRRPLRSQEWFTSWVHCRIEIVRNCQSYLGFNFPSDLWPNRVKRFDVKYATSGGSFVKYEMCPTR